MTHASRMLQAATWCTLFISSVHAHFLSNPMIRVTASCDAPKAGDLSDEIDALKFDQAHQQPPKPRHTKQEIEALKTIINDTTQDPTVLDDARKLFHDVVINLNNAVQSITIEHSEVAAYVNIVKIQCASWKNTADHIVGNKKIIRSDVINMMYTVQRLRAALNELIQVGIYHAQNSTLTAWQLPSTSLIINVLKSINNVVDFFSCHTTTIRHDTRRPESLVALLETTENHCTAIISINQSLIAELERNTSQENTLDAFTNALNDYTRHFESELISWSMEQESEVLLYLNLLLQNIFQHLFVNQ